jgi:phosphoribosyl-AMP cyclohydrolase
LKLSVSHFQKTMLTFYSDKKENIWRLSESSGTFDLEIQVL